MPDRDPDPDSAPQPGADDPNRAAVLAAARALDAGGLVGIPTETVYGLAARADLPQALAAMVEAKGSPSARAFTWHAADKQALTSFDELRPVLQRLAARYWPGPLTLVLRGEPKGLEATCTDGWCGVRVPGHPTTRALLQATEGPVVASSANHAGQPPATDAAEVQRVFANRLDHLLDGGPSPLGAASSVLAVGHGRFELLREGVLSLADLRRSAGLRLGFVCTGNTCRSPMAEGLARAALTERLGLDPAAFGFGIASMGVSAGPGLPASTGALEAMAERQLDLSAHASTPAAEAPLGEFDALYCMTSAHRAMLISSLPPALCERVHLLDPDSHDVPDPYGASLGVYRKTRDAIETYVAARLDEWA